MAANPQVPQVPAKVVFVCAKHRNLKIIYRQSESQAIWEDGKQVIHNTAQEVIEFKNGMFETDDPKKIAFLRNYPLMTGRTPEGRVSPQIIREMQGVDPNQVRYHQMLKQLGIQGVVAAVEKAYNIQPGVQIQDPVQATLQQRQQGVAVNGGINQ